MMWTRLNGIADAPAEGLLGAKSRILDLSDYIWLITRDDGTPILVAGVYRPTIVSGDQTLWMIPYTALRPLDWRGIVKLFSILKDGINSITAYVDRDNTAAVRVVEHLGFTLVEDQPDRIYKWQR